MHIMSITMKDRKMEKGSYDNPLKSEKADRNDE